MSSDAPDPPQDIDAGAAAEELGEVAASVPTRSDNRIAWVRDDIELSVEHPGGSRVRLPAATSDIGKTGVGITTHTFLHSGTVTRIRLPGIDGSPIDTRGEVRWCRYEDGLHHCGISFVDPVRLERIIPRDQWTEAMLQDDSLKVAGKVVHLFSSPLDHHMITVAMRETLIKVTPVHSTGAVLDALRNGDTDILVIDIRTEEIDLSQFREQLGDTAFGGPIVFVCDTDEESMEASCVFGEPAAVLKCPLESKTISHRLTEVLEEWQRLSGGEDALFTKLRKDDGIAPMLESYHEACRSTAEAIRAKFARDDVAGTLALLRRVSGTASTFGYGVLAKHAESAIAKVQKEGSLRDASAEIAQVRNLLRNLRGFPKANAAA